jgi:hypothetical protein
MILFFYIEMTTYWIDSGQPRLTRKICYQDHKIVITLQKVNEKNILKLNS